VSITVPEPSHNILLVEDSPGDVRLTREALQEASVTAVLHVVTDGEAALDYLRRNGEYAQAIEPSLVLLDLNLPRLDGREVLRIMKSDPILRRIPVVVLTTSSNERDILSVYDVGGNCFVTKPLDYDDFVDTIGEIVSFWFGRVCLPPPIATAGPP
jgi:two-component system, chemotaxis family, response regulator Rcp1